MVLILATTVVIATVVLINAIKSKTKTYAQPTYSPLPGVPVEDRTIPDMPDGFGPKCLWFAIRSENAQQIAEVMNLQHLDPCNWTVGIKEAYQGDIFITPVIDGWTMVLGWGLPTGDTPDEVEKVKKLLISLSTEFGDAQYFGTHRVSDFHVWMKAVNGTVTRAYGYADGDNFIVEGVPTDFEAGLNLVNTFSEEARQKDYYSREDVTHPNEQTVMDVAANWSVDPSELYERKDLKPGLGYLANYDFYY